DPFALSFGGFRRLVLPTGAAACSKGHSLFYGQRLGAPPLALRQVVRSLDRLKEDLSKMLIRQEPDVIFTERTNANDRAAVDVFDGGDGAATASNANNANNASTRAGGSGEGGGAGRGGGSGSGGGDGGGKTVGAHLAILRARCPSLYKHAANVISSMGTGSRGDGDGDGDGGTDGGDGKPPAWRVYAPAGVPIDALQLVVSYLYQDAGVFDKPKPGTNEPRFEPSSFPRSPTTAPTVAQQAQPDRVRDRRERLSEIRSKAGAAALGRGGGAEEGLKHGTMELPMDPWEEVGEGEDESAAGFGSFGGAYGSEGKYDGAGLDRLMGVMAAARVLELNRLQGLCEKRAEAFIDSRTVHKVLRRAAEGGFPYLKRRCLEFCLTHLGEVILADVLSLSAASEGARKAAATETPFKGAGKVPCIEELLGAAACFVPAESYQASNGFASAAKDQHKQHKPEAGEPVEASIESSIESSQHTATKKATPEGQHVSQPASQRPAATTFGSWKPPTDKRDGPSDSKGDAEKEGIMGHPIEAQARAAYKKNWFPVFGDFKIRTGEGMPAVTVHRCILAARSGFFRALLEGGMADAGHTELTLKFEPIACMDALVEFLRFLYTGRAETMDPLTALDVLFLTNGEEGSGGESC
ncbi:unnamed protein product, partial [Laminaria digitata]